MGPRSHPERYSLESAGEALGLTGYDPIRDTIQPTDLPEVKEVKRERAAHGKKEFYEMTNCLKKYEDLSGATGAAPLRTSTGAVEAAVEAQGTHRVSNHMHPSHNV